MLDVMLQLILVVEVVELLLIMDLVEVPMLEVVVQEL
jgi:hypothetical protein